MNDERRAVYRTRRVAPSILSADFARLGVQLDEVIAAGARVIHVDVMDGHFVPPITIGPLIVDAIAERVRQAGGVVDVHLMIESPERQIEDFARAGADSITFHVEATAHSDRVIGAVQEAGCLAGVALNPGTPVEAVSEVIAAADIALAMTVNPGWGGQAFIPSSPRKVARLRDMAEAASKPVSAEAAEGRGGGDAAAIEVDGGIAEATAPVAVEAGANLLVAGSAVFGSSDPASAYREIAAAAGA